MLKFCICLRSVAPDLMAMPEIMLTTCEASRIVPFVLWTHCNLFHARARLKGSYLLGMLSCDLLCIAFLRLATSLPPPSQETLCDWHFAHGKYNQGKRKCQDSNPQQAYQRPSVSCRESIIDCTDDERPNGSPNAKHQIGRSKLICKRQGLSDISLRQPAG